MNTFYSLAKIFLLLIFITGIFLAGFYYINENDVWYHLKTGEIIVKTKSIPDSEIYTYTKEGEKWIHPDWLAQIILYSVYKISGLNGLIIFKCIIILLSFSVLLFTVRLNKNSLFISIPIIIYICYLYRERFDIRPHILFYLILSLYLYLIYSYNKKGNNKTLILIILLQIFWNNIHASCILGVIIFSIYSLSVTVYGKLIKKSEKLNFNVIITNIILLLALLMTPNGVSLLKAIYNVFAEKFYSQFISEWRYSLNYYSIIIVSLSFVLRFSIKRAWNNRSIFEILLFLFASYLSLKAMRFEIVFWLMVIPLFINNTNKIINSFSDMTKIKKIMIKTKLNILLPLIIIFVSINIIHKNNIYKHDFGLGIDKKKIPIKTVEFLDKNNIKGNIFNTDINGPYITWKLYPDLKVFMDIRGHIYEKYLMMCVDESIWLNNMNKYNINIALIRYPYKNEKYFNIHSFLRNSNQWQMVYWDDNAVLYLKKEKRFENILKKHAKSYSDPINMKNNGIYSLNEINKVLEDNPDSYTARLMLLYAYLNSSKIDKALDEGLEILKRYPYDAKINNILGFIMINKKKFQEAINYFKKTIKYQPSNHNAYNNLGLIYVREFKNYSKGYKYWNKYLKLNPNDEIIRKEIELLKEYIK